MKNERGLAIVVAGAVAASFRPDEVFDKGALLDWAREQDIFEIFDRSDVLTLVAESFDPEDVFDSDVIQRSAEQYD
jgi:hypothetical protein